MSLYHSSTENSLMSEVSDEGGAFHIINNRTRLSACGVIEVEVVILAEGVDIPIEGGH